MENTKRWVNQVVFCFIDLTCGADCSREILSTWIWRNHSSSFIYISPLNIDNFALFMPVSSCICWQIVSFTLKFWIYYHVLRKFGILDTVQTVYWWNPLQLEGPTKYTCTACPVFCQVNTYCSRFGVTGNLHFVGHLALIFSFHDCFLSNEKLALCRTLTFLTFSWMSSAIGTLLMLYLQ